MDGYLDLLRVIVEQGVIENVAPIQLGIRLLIPEGSRMLELEEVRRLADEIERDVGQRDVLLENRRMPTPLRQSMTENESIVAEAKKILEPIRVCPRHQTFTPRGTL